MVLVSKEQGDLDGANGPGEKKKSVLADHRRIVQEDGTEDLAMLAQAFLAASFVQGGCVYDVPAVVFIQQCVV